LKHFDDKTRYILGIFHINYTFTDLKTYRQNIDNVKSMLRIEFLIKLYYQIPPIMLVNVLLIVYLVCLYMAYKGASRSEE